MVQRIIEILSNIPFLLVVIILSLAVPPQWKDRLGLYLILGISCALWMDVDDLPFADFGAQREGAGLYCRESGDRGGNAEDSLPSFAAQFGGDLGHSGAVFRFPI